MMTSTTDRIRLDHLLTERGLAPSRSRARDMIARACVSVDGNSVSKPGLSVTRQADIAIADPAQNYVSRAALKLIAGLDASGIEVSGKNAIDLGASTGGFTQVLLERGASQVLAVDVGHGQMAPSLRDDPRVTLLENFNARDIDETTQEIAECEIVVSDLSFVSLTIAAEPTLIHCHPNAKAVLLVKPQFEVGRDGVGKKGLVTDITLIEVTNERLKNWFAALPGWRITHFLPSPIGGGDGNREFLLCGERG